MANNGTLSGMVHDVITTVATNVSIFEVENRLKEIDKANVALSKRWDQMMSSPHIASWRASKSLGAAEQIHLIIDLENLLGKLTSVCIAQQNALTAVVGTLKNLNRK